MFCMCIEYHKMAIVMAFLNCYGIPNLLVCCIGVPDLCTSLSWGPDASGATSFLMFDMPIVSFLCVDDKSFIFVKALFAFGFH